MGVETLVRISAHDAEWPCTVKSLAKWINRSVSYTEGLMACLRRAGLVKAVRGPGGGYSLSRPADRITVAQVFDAFQEPRGLSGRPLNSVTLEPEEIEVLHGTDLLWEALKSYILLFLNGVSLADITPLRDVSFAEEDKAGAPTARVRMGAAVLH